MHDLNVSQDAMYQDSTIKQWYPAVIQRLCSDQEVTRYLQEMVLYTEKPISCEAFYTSEQELSIF